MPDLWTTNPLKLRTALESVGATCGVPPRVIESRDPEITCYFDTGGVRRDIYLHSVYEIHLSALFLLPLGFGMALSCILGLMVGRRRTSVLE
jgi:hypothetical protein